VDNYAKLVNDNLTKLYANLPADLDRMLPAEKNEACFTFQAFGETCRITPGGIYLADEKQDGVPGILISLYALNALPDAPVTEPFKAFKEFTNSMPYAGAFVSHTEQVLVPHTGEIESRCAEIAACLSGSVGVPETGDFSFLVYPLPKIALGYIFYEADEDFPASATCLYSNNAGLFLPMDALADVGEYTSRKILKLING
jgi:Domain of unknown function (DUF3786)